MRDSTWTLDPMRDSNDVLDPIRTKEHLYEVGPHKGQTKKSPERDPTEAWDPEKDSRVIPYESANLRHFATRPHRFGYKSSIM